jgi:hypothetical protein
MTETLKDLALAAYHAAVQAEAERVEAAHQQLLNDQAQALSTGLQKALGLEAKPGGPTVEVDGLTFTVIADEAGHWEQAVRVVGICPTCGRRTFNPFSELVELGAILANPPRCSFCTQSDSSQEAMA